jgi:hypothetical protein
MGRRDPGAVRRAARPAARIARRRQAPTEHPGDSRTHGTRVERPRNALPGERTACDGRHRGASGPRIARGRNSVLEDGFRSRSRGGRDKSLGAPRRSERAPARGGRGLRNPDAVHGDFGGVSARFHGSVNAVHLQVFGHQIESVGARASADSPARSDSSPSGKRGVSGFSRGSDSGERGAPWRMPSPKPDRAGIERPCRRAYAGRAPAVRRPVTHGDAVATLFDGVSGEGLLAGLGFLRALVVAATFAEGPKRGRRNSGSS